MVDRKYLRDCMLRISAGLFYQMGREEDVKIVSSLVYAFILLHSDIFHS